MALPNEKKLKNLFEQWPVGTVATSSWLESIGVSKQLRLSYKENNWLVPLDNGAFVRYGERVELDGAIYAIQKQLNLDIHSGGQTALALQGHAHYLRLGIEKLHLFAPAKAAVPKWFRAHDWGSPLGIHCSNFIPQSIGLVPHGNNIFNILISGRERAILECLYLAPDQLDLVECYQIMEGLASMRPQLLQQLLMQCSSIKVKRLFFYMAEKAGHAWLKHIDKSAINLGHGPRSIVKGGIYIKSHDITIPRELAKL